MLFKSILLTLSLIMGIKYFACILGMLILLLSISPCMDGHRGHGIPADMEQTVVDNGNGIDNHVDLCSDFCSCQCCQSPIFITQTEYFIPKSQLVRTYYHYHQLLSNVRMTVDNEPPRV